MCLFISLYFYLYSIHICFCETDLSVAKFLTICILSVFVSVFVSVYISVFASVCVSVFETDLSVATFCCSFLTFHLHCPSSCEPKSSIGPRATSPNSNPSLGFSLSRILFGFDRAGKKRGSDITEKRPGRFEAWRRTGVSWVRVVYFCAGRRVGAQLCLSETCAETKSKQQTDKN